MESGEKMWIRSHILHLVLPYRNDLFTLESLKEIAFELENKMISKTCWLKTLESTKFNHIPLEILELYFDFGFDYFLRNGFISQDSTNGDKLIPSNFLILALFLQNLGKKCSLTQRQERRTEEIQVMLKQKSSKMT